MLQDDRDTGLLYAALSDRERPMVGQASEQTLLVITFLKTLNSKLDDLRSRSRMQANLTAGGSDHGRKMFPVLLCLANNQRFDLGWAGSHNLLLPKQGRCIPNLKNSTDGD